MCDIAELVTEQRWDKPAASGTEGLARIFVCLAEAWVCSDAETKLPLEKERLK